MRTVITGTGSFIPADIKLNKDFTIHDFYNPERRRIPLPPSPRYSIWFGRAFYPVIPSSQAMSFSSLPLEQA